MDPSHALDAAIAALEAHRSALGDAAIDAAVAALRAATASAAPQRLRQLSVLFVDIVDSTHLLQSAGVHRAPEVLDAALQRFARIVQAHGGQVLRFTGDGLKAAFGTQGLREDEAARAVRAGLAILAAAEAHAEAVGVEHGVQGFAVRAGIHTGPVVLGGGVEADRTAIGDAVHLAARLEQSAPAGQLRISRETQAQVRGLFELEEQPLLALKGFDEPVPTWLVTGIVAGADATTLRGIEGIETPLVGRDAELEAMLAAWTEARDQCSVRAVGVIADAGLGKTRLRRELLARLSLPRRDAGLLQARAHPGGTLQPYGLLRQLVARWFSIADDLDAASARRQLVDGVAPLLAERAVARAQALGHLLGLDFAEAPAVQALGPRELRETAFAALAEAIHALAAQSPLVVVLDDLHWADTESLDFVRQLAMPAPVPMLLVLLARPALRERELEPLVDESVAARTIELAPLGAGAGPALAAALLEPLPAAPPELHALLVDRAAGNPFFMEELLRMLIDDGVIDAHRRPWRLRSRWQSELRVPGTLVGVLQARLDALPADELLALQRAAIVGTVFWDSALAAIDAGAPARLPALAERRLVQARATSAFAQAAEHAFHHQLLHDVTYDTVLGAARRAGHLRVARWLAARLGERAGEFLGITAEHFERGGDSAQALEFYDRARSDAAQRHAHEAVIQFVDRCLRQPALVSPTWRYQLLSARHDRLEALGRTDEAARMLDAMAELAEREDSDTMRADLTVARMLQADRAGHAAEAERLARQAVALAEASDAASAGALARGELAWLALMHGDHAAAAAHLEPGIAWARRAATRSWREGGYAHYELQLRTIGIESLLIQRRCFDAARAVDEALAGAPSNRLRDRINLLLRRSRALSAVGDLPGADDAVRQALEITAAIQIPRLHSDALAQLAWLRRDQQRDDEAERLAAEAETLARQIANAATTAVMLDLRAELAHARGERQQARALWSEALALLTGLEATDHVLDTRLGLALLQAEDGHLDAAREAVHAVLADAGPAVASDPWPKATESTLLRAWQLLDRIGDRQALPLRAELQRRLDEQRAQAPDDAARARLTQQVQHWRALTSAR